MLNKAILMGRLTRDPELRHTQSNMAVCSFSLAIDRGRKDQNGNNRTAIEVNCDEVSFGETKKSRDAYNAGNQGGFGGYDNGSQMRPEPAASQVAPAFDLPAGDSDFQELADDDGDVPF